MTARYQFITRNGSNTGIGGISNEPALLSQAYNTSGTGHNLQITDSQVLSSTIINETRFAFARSASRLTPQSTDPTIVVLGAFTGGGNSSGTDVDRQDHYEL